MATIAGPHRSAPRIAVSGPESTGKTTLCRSLGSALGLHVVDEYARIHLDRHGPTYGRDDLNQIAREHLRREQAATGPVLFDTDAANLVIWYRDKGWTVPTDLAAHLATVPYDLVLLTTPDIAWASDPQRENPGRGMELFHRFQALYQQVGQPFVTITGRGDQRTLNARAALADLIRMPYL